LANVHKSLSADAMPHRVWSDHLIGLGPIARLVPAWIPFHVFWIGFFGIAFIATGVSIGLDRRRVWGAFGLGLMFAIWVLTLHLPRVSDVYGIAGAPRSPNEWSSLFIAIALLPGLEVQRRSATGAATGFDCR
jgi:hypothetical protein